MNFLYIPASYQLRHARLVKQCLPDPHNLLIKNSATTTILEISQTIRNLAKAQQLPVHGIAVSDPKILAAYLQREHGIDLANKSEVTLDKYQGAMVSHHQTTVKGKKYTIPVVFINNPEQLSYSAQADYLTAKFLSKLFDREWFSAPAMDWELLTEDNASQLYNEATKAKLIAVDIETKLAEIPAKVSKAKVINGISTDGMWYTGIARTESGGKSTRLASLCPLITCIGYAMAYQTADGAWFSKTVVIPMNSEANYRWAKKFNLLEAPKVMQNGRYDSSYFLRYDMPLHNWIYDTYGLMHCWQVELKRGLHNVSALTLRNHMYWKDESSGNLYEYNAKDCHATLWSCLVLLSTIPDWAVTNYVGIFKQVFPCISCAAEGWRQDEEEARKLWAKYQAEIAADTQWWYDVIKPYFNTNSPKQVGVLFKDLLKTGVKKCDKTNLQGIVHKHPLWRLMVDKLLATRKNKKADSTYMNITTFASRILYELDPFGTETGRFASKASNFWCGTQIQNIPDYAKSQFIADPDWELSGLDNSQSESRTTAYIVGDQRLIDAVEHARDFHVRNASMFFGVSEEELFRLKTSNGGAELVAKSPEQKAFDQAVDDFTAEPNTRILLPTELSALGVTGEMVRLAALERQLFKKYRNKIGKRLNHGANYNMGANVLIDTMTPLGIIEAKHTLGLPSHYTFVDVANHLLSCFDAAYPLIRSTMPGGYHYQIVKEIAETGCLTTPDLWVRKTFCRPGHLANMVDGQAADEAFIDNKRDLNKVVAHKPQSWSVRSINRAFFDAWYQYQIVEDVARFKAQVHDELIWQTRPEHTKYVIAGVSELMARPNKMYDPVTKEEVGSMVIPNSPAPPAQRWSALEH